MALNGSGIATAIAALSISGVTVKDLTAIPQQVTARDCPILYPSPDSWMSGGSATIMTFGFAASSYWETTRTLNYIYLHAAAGSERTLANYYQGLTQKVDAIWTALIGLNIAGVDVTTIGYGPFGVLADPSGAQFYGCLIGLTVKEKVNP